jgi:hypothetical protein
MLTIDFSHFRPSEAPSPIQASNISGRPLAVTFSFCGRRVFRLAFEASRYSPSLASFRHMRRDTKQKVRTLIPMNPTKMGGDEEEEEEVGLGEAVAADASAELLEEGDVEDMVRVGLVSVMIRLHHCWEPNPNKCVKDTRSRRHQDTAD